MAPRKNMMEFLSRMSPKTLSKALSDQSRKEDEQAGSAGVSGSQDSGSKRCRPARRCVRSLPLDLEKDGIEREGENEEGGGGGGGSGGRKLKKTTRKTTLRSSKRAKCGDVSSKENGDLQGAIGSQRSDFFVKISEKRKRHKSLQREKGEHGCGDTRITDEIHQRWREEQNKEDKCNVHLSSTEEDRLVCQIQMPDDNHFVARNQDDHSNYSSPVKAIDLRLEAKRAAEENARLFSGKQIHPFFTSCQFSKRLSETCHLESQCDSILQEDVIMPYAPVHVLQTSPEDDVLLNWQDWAVFKGNVLKCADPITTEDTSLANFYDSKPLKIDSFMNISNLLESTILEQQLDRRKSGLATSTSSPSLSIDQQSSPVELQAHDHAPVGITEKQLSRGLHDKRMKPYYLRCINYQPDFSLWVDKYRPHSASEVCGNSDSVKFISDWLHSWYIWNPENDKVSSHDDDHDWIEDNDAVDGVNEFALKNPLVLIGPIGSGKSAAIYACAKEQGFQIIEVNASDRRSGTLVKHKFREAMESQCLKKWSNEDPVGSQNQHGIESFLAENKGLTCGNSDVGTGNSESILRSYCLEQMNAVDMEVSCNFMEYGSLGNQIASKTLILFEDFDTTFDEDRGLIATIQELAETAKRPIILTSNSRDPILPSLVDRAMVNFTLPSLDELVSHAYTICLLEAINLSPQLIEHVVRFCQGDIRKTLMLLQFWCQSGSDQGGNKSYCAYGSLPFNIDAGHYVIQKVIPWGFPSQLSEYIEKEISKSLAKMKTISSLTDELVTGENFEGLLGHENKDMSKGSQQDGLSKWNCSVHDCTLDSSMLSDISPSKFIEVTKQLRHKRRIVLSDSEDEPDTDKVDLSEQQPEHLGEEFVLEVPNGSFSMQECPHMDYPDTTIHEDLLRGPKTNESACTHHFHESPRTSCIAELSFVPETRIDNGDLEQTSSMACFPDIIKNAHLDGSNLLQKLGTELTNQGGTNGELDRVSETVFWSTCNTAAESVLGCDDSHVEPPQAILRMCPLIDECSRAEFSSTHFMTETESKHPVMTDLVQEMWKKLQSQGVEIKACIETEQGACSSLKIATGLTELISDADVMLTAGYMLLKETTYSGDHHVELMSAFAEHGLCFYANKGAAMGRHLDPTIKLDLALEMLASGMDSLTLGKLVMRESADGFPTQVKFFGELMMGTSSNRLEWKSTLSDTLASVVPRRSYMASRGAAFHEYLSFLSQISKEESARLAQADKSTRYGRVRSSGHYLKTGAS